MAIWENAAEYTNVLFSFVTLLVHLRLGITSTVSLEPAIGVVQLCPGDAITFICTTMETGILNWRTSDVSNPTGVSTFFTNNSMIVKEKSLGSFTVLQESAIPLVSTATLTNYFDYQQNGTVLTCANILSPKPPPSAAASATLALKDPPSAPMSPEFSPQSFSYAVLSWISPTDSSCVTYYTITLTNITEGNVSYIYNTTTNTTSKTVSDLTQGAEYSFSVAGFDIAGRVGEESMSAKVITFNTPERVTSMQISNQQNNISLTWMPPPLSTRPPVTGYSISHNTTGKVLLNQTSDTEFTVEGVAPGVYFFAVSAVNVLGDGEEMTVTATVIALSSTNVQIKPSSTVVETINTKEFKGSIMMTVMDASTVSSSINNTPAENTTSGLSMVYIVAALGVIIVIVVIIALLLSVLLVLSTRKKKGTKSTEEIHIKAPFPDMKMTFSDNKAYDIVTKPDESTKNIIKQDPVYETLH